MGTTVIIRKLNIRGFTIIELLISMTVFSVMLLLVSGVIVQLSRQFYKGLVQSRTQEVARNIGEELAKNIQFSSTPPIELVAGNPGAICIADRRYSFTKNQQLGSGPSQTPRVLTRGVDCSIAPPLPTDVELIGERMRLAKLTLSPDASGKVWRVEVRVVLGENDLVCSPSQAGDCDSNSVSGFLTAEDLSCKSKTGSQFCAVAEYSMTVVRQL